ncbi:MAG TPA: hypothetical protein DGF10_06830 [Acidimicrobiaceae bacterium]|nr:hypothetical protein [Acidimicrobiaceae bacterium]HCV34366.1 hypothetical protein [Acidimicrobiaceae bacterium]
MVVEPRPWSVVARNLPEHADNAVHTDDGARAAGFRAALVAGTTLHAYLTHSIIEAWGPGWLADGTSMVEFLAPVQDGDRVDCVPVTRPDGSTEIRAEVGSELRARLVAHRGWRSAPAVAAVPDGEVLPSYVEVLEGPRTDYAHRAGDDLSLCAQEGLVHPCVWTALANEVMVRHLVEPPWIHVRSRIIHHGIALVGATVRVDATVVDRFETRRGSCAVVDVRISVDDHPVATVRHEALVSLAVPSG